MLIQATRCWQNGLEKQESVAVQQILSSDLQRSDFRKDVWTAAVNAVDPNNDDISFQDEQKTCKSWLMDENDVAEGKNDVEESGSIGALLKLIIAKRIDDLKSLDVSGQRVGYQRADVMAKLVESNTRIKTLEMENNDIGDQGAVAMAKALQTSTSMETLQMRNNGIGDQGAAAMAEAL